MNDTSLQGPQEVELLDLLTRIRELRVPEVRSISTAAVGRRDIDRMLAHRQALDAMARTGEDADAWRQGTKWGVANAFADAAAGKPTQGAPVAWVRAGEALLDAVTGLAARHVIDEDTYRFLTGPVAAVLGPLHPHDDAGEEE